MNHQGLVKPEEEVEPIGNYYLIEKLLSKWTSQERTQYLVRWFGYGPEHDVWYDITNLDSAGDLVDKYN